jgi:diguanylate cyclase (GGDEF)-like protein/PAS domain S-box-containing protein
MSKPGTPDWSNLTTLLDRFGDPLLVFDRTLACRFANVAASLLFGVNRDDLVGRPASQLFPPEFADIAESRLDAALTGQTWQDRILRDYAHEGARWLDARVEPCLDESGHIIGAIYSARDVTVQVAIEERARMAGIMFDHTTEGVMMLNGERAIQLVNPAFTTLTGYTASEAKGEWPREFVASSGGVDDPYEAAWEALTYENTWQGEIVYRRRDGRVLPTWQTVVKVCDVQENEDVYMVVFTDLTERQRYEQQLERLVYYDLLTGLPNRALLSDRAAQAIARAERLGTHLALLFVDLDRFKVINDTLGNYAGDQVLRSASRRLQETDLPECTVSRYGADQFVVLIPEVDSPDQAATLARRLLEALGKPYDHADQPLTITASVGIAIYPDDGEERETLLHHAETAMQAAKKAGRNAFRFFTQDMNQRSTDYLLLESYLRQGLANKEFLLYYQPQIDMHSGEVIGFEALMRWNQPDLGLVPPNRFIPTAEETGLIVAMGQWALHEACRQNKAWQAAGLITVPVAVNVSALQFAEALEDVTAGALSAAGLAPEWLELEVTESTLMGDINIAINTLSKLKAMGVRLSIDDFGTGYSSLAYLKRFPLDKLKVDRSFVIDILDDADDAAIAGAVVSMAKNLRLKVIAEGVETQGQRDFLATLGCDEMQGYLVAPPLPPDEVPDFLAKWRARQA